MVEDHAGTSRRDRALSQSPCRILIPLSPALVRSCIPSRTAYALAMKTKSPAPAGKPKIAPRHKRETVGDWLRSIESTRKPRQDRDFTAMLMAERARE